MKEFELPPIIKEKLNRYDDYVLKVWLNKRVKDFTDEHGEFWCTGNLFLEQMREDLDNG